MADTHTYPLLVELEENNVPRLKIKLIKYFQSKKSNGGDCEVVYENGSRTAVLRFRREEDQQNVLAKETHQISLDNGVLNMTVRLPTNETAAEQEAPPDQENTKSVVAVKNQQSSTDEPSPAAVQEVQEETKDGDDASAEEELCSTMALLENVPEALSQEFLEMLVENVLKDSNSPPSPNSFTLEYIPSISSAVVTFHSVKENLDFMRRCPQNRTFSKRGLSVRMLEATEEVVVDDLHNFSEDLLRLYFENAGGDVESVVVNNEEQSAIITFKDHKAVQKIIKKKHHIKQEEIRVYPFYKSLGTALYGKDKPTLKLPAAISVPMDNAIWRYLHDHRAAAESVHSHLAKTFCTVNLDKSTVLLSPVSSLLRQKDAKAIIKEWSNTVKSAFSQALSQFKSLKFSPESDAWEESEEKIGQMLLEEDVVVVADKANGVLSVAGLAERINRLEQSISDVVNQIVKRVQRQKCSVTREIRLTQSMFHILCQDGLQDHLLCIYPELKMVFKKDSQELRVTGLRDEIIEVNKVIHETTLKLQRQNLEMDKFVLDFLKGGQQEELTNRLLISDGINAAFEISAQKVQLIAVSDKDLNDAEDHLKRLIISQNIEVEDRNLLKKPEWAHLVGQLEDANNKGFMRIRIHAASEEVVVSGHKDNVIKVSSELNTFLTKNAHVEDTVVVKPNIKVEYIKKLDTSWLEEVSDNVAVAYRKEAICLSGPRVDVTEAKTVAEDMVSSVVYENFKVSMPGAKKFFQDKEAMYNSSLLTETGCLVQLSDGTSGGQDSLAQGQVPKPVYQFQTSDGVEIAVCKADMCSYPVHAVVNSSNQDLDNSGGLSGALLKAAGHQLQVECNKLISLNGQLKPGDCVITGAGGQLCCKKIIHAVGPRYEAAKHQKAVAQLKRAVKGSLELAEKNGCLSVALPAISRNLGFPLSLCASTIIKAVKDHCDEKYDENTLKKIHFVNNDDVAVQAMETAVREEYGNSAGSNSRQTPLQFKVPSMKHSGSDLKCLGQVQTKEGLSINLIKGNIEGATTEVIVNTLSEDLSLDKGAVSRAILSVAGYRLQQLVKAKSPSGNIGDIIVTEGCNLKSKQVFHAVAPHWDNGQGTAEKALSGIFKECLDMAESSGLTSISFPAMGTGNLGFPKDLAASLMLDEIATFSSKTQPKNLKTVKIILHSRDTQTIQVFSGEFQKMFPNASCAPATQSSGPFSKVVSSSGMHETKMGSVAIQVVIGDITKETTDVIVNSSNEKFTLKSGVSKAILDAAGPAVEAECQNLGAQANTGMIMTQPGNLKCKKILHLAGQTDPVKISKVVRDALQMCMNNSYASVSFPAIGTGQGNVQARHVADAILDAVIDVLRQNTNSTLKTIRIVIFLPHMLNDFYNSMLQRQAAEPKESSRIFKNLKSKITSLFGGDDKQQKNGDFVMEGGKVEPACFHICGESQTRVDSAKQWINDLISKEQNSISISNKAILSFTAADRQRIADLQKTMSVSIRTESKNAQVSITISGLSKDILSASHEIHEMLRKVRDEEDLKEKVELASAVVEWQYQKTGFQFLSFSSMANYELEQGLKKKLPSVNVKVDGQNYTVAMPNGPATNSQGHTLNIKRIDKQAKDDDIPETWDPMPANTTSHAFTIKAGAAEYIEVQNLFRATCPRNITKIERIQTPVLWKSLQIKKRDMEQRNGHQNNEKRLFHGTSHDTVAYINANGFNRSFAGKNAACYGNGTYFAVNAQYSASDTYSKPNPNGEKYMYLCRVLTGDFTTGHQNMIVPPSKSAVSVQKYDSVVDNMAKPNMFIIFHDSQAYPEYLITFK